MKVSIPNPCSENWEDMTERVCGRFCVSCEKVVVDFTRMSDNEFVAYFRDFKNNTCGRFTERQLNMELQDRSVAALSFGKLSKYVAVSMLTVAGLSGEAFGQKISTIQTVDSQRKESKSNVQEKYEGKYIAIGGTVVDESNEVLIGAQVSVQNSDIRTNADIDGKFYLSIPESLFEDGIIFLKVSYVGFETGFVTVNNQLYKPAYSIKLKLSPMITGEFVTIKVTKWLRFKWWIRDNFL